MSISDIKSSKKTVLKHAFGNFLAALFCVLFGAVYELFSHDVFSYFMLYAFCFPLVLGTLPMLIMYMTKFSHMPSRVVLNLYNSAIATLTFGSLFEGVLEIFGTMNDLTAVYWIVGFSLLLISVVLYAVGIIKEKKGREDAQY